MEGIFSIICLIYGVYALTVIVHPQRMIPFLAVSCTIDAFRQAYVFSGAIISAGITIYSYDLPIFVMLAIIILWKKEKYTPKIILPLIVVLLLILSSMISGLFKNGLNLYYLTDVRIFLSTIVPIFYFILYPVEFTYEDIQAIRRNLYILLGYSYFTWVLRLTTGINLVPNEVQGGFRVFGSTTTFIMSAIALFLIYKEVFTSENRKISVSTILLVLAIVIMQHNSVWTAFFVGLVLVTLLYRVEQPEKKFGYIYNPSAFKQIIFLVLIAGIIIIAWKDNPIMRAVTDSLDKYNQFGTGEGTIGSRQTIWLGYIESIQSKSEWLFGKPFGEGWFVNYRGSLSFAPPHNAYIEGVLRIGLVGTIMLFGSLLYIAIASLLRRKVIIFVILLSSFVYLYAYMFSWQMSVLWGILIGLYYTESSDSIMYDDLKY